MAGNGIVVTNAHVVAGQDDTTVQVGGDGPGLEADAIWFDPATTSRSCACQVSLGRPRCG